MSTAKEVIYDEQIWPLMAQIIAICKEHKIANLCSFDLGYDEEAETNLVCTTAMLSEDFDPQPEFVEALNCIKKTPHYWAFTITTQKGTPQ